MKSAWKWATRPNEHSIQPEYASHSGWILMLFVPNKKEIQAELSRNSAWIAKRRSIVFQKRKCKYLEIKRLETMLKMGLFTAKWQVRDRKSKLRYSCYLDKGLPRKENGVQLNCRNCWWIMLIIINSFQNSGSRFSNYSDYSDCSNYSEYLDFSDYSDYSILFF